MRSYSAATGWATYERHFYVWATDPARHTHTYTHHAHAAAAAAGGGGGGGGGRHNDNTSDGNGNGKYSTGKGPYEVDIASNLDLHRYGRRLLDAYR